MTDSYDHRSLAIVIPACAEEEHLPLTLQSLNENFLSRDEGENHVVIVLNQPKGAKDLQIKNQELFGKLNQKRSSYRFKLHVLDHSKEGLDHGVGEARRIGLDFAEKNILHEDRDLLLCLDADCPVAKNYAGVLRKQPDEVQAFLVEFEHPLSSLSNALSVTLYEIFLRYMAVMLREVGSPFGFVAMGSRIGLTRKAYSKSGGMVIKDATEDFHFLNRLRKNIPIWEVSETRIFPSARISNRVYLGTGFFQGAFLKNPESAFKDLRVPRLEAFGELREFMMDLEDFFENSSSLDPWKGKLDHRLFHLDGLQLKLEKLRKNSNSRENFAGRIHQLFDGLQTWRFLRGLETCPPFLERKEFLEALSLYLKLGSDNPSEILTCLRPNPLPSRYLPGRFLG